MHTGVHSSLNHSTVSSPSALSQFLYLKQLQSLIAFQTESQKVWNTALLSPSPSVCLRLLHMYCLCYNPSSPDRNLHRRVQVPLLSILFCIQLFLRHFSSVTVLSWSTRLASLAVYLYKWGMVSKPLEINVTYQGMLLLKLFLQDKWRILWKWPYFEL